MNKLFKVMIKNNLHLIIFSLVLAIGAVLSQLFIPIYSGKVIDNLIEGYDQTYVINYFVIIACLIMVYILSQNVYDNLVALLNQRIIKSLRIKLFSKFNYVTISELDKYYKGDLSSRCINDIEHIGIGLIAGFKQFYQGIIMIIASLVFMFILNWILGLVVVIVTPLSIVIAKFIGNRTFKYFKKQSSSAGILTSKATESLNNYTAIVTNNLSNNFINDFDKENKEYYEITKKGHFISTLINPSSRLVNNIIYALVIMIGCVLLISGKEILLKVGLGTFSVGALQSILLYTNKYTTPFNKISSTFTELQSSLASFNRVYEITSKEDEEDLGKELINNFEHIEYKDVGFSYDGKIQILNNINIRIEKNSRIAIVGETGCGKTTLVSLILRFYEVNSGKIFVNGRDIKEISKKSLRNLFEIVLQDSWVFDGSLLDNLVYGNPNATIEEVEQACKATRFDSVVERLSGGFNTHISSKSDLSEGERQLLCITRALISNKQFVIFDEATSNIDARSEKIITESLAKLFENKTSITIAHRLSTIKNSDLIIVVDKGQIVEIGSHKQLLKNESYYFNLYNSQFNG